MPYKMYVRFNFSMAEQITSKFNCLKQINNQHFMLWHLIVQNSDSLDGLFGTDMR